jgi:hypothetical protein
VWLCVMQLQHTRFSVSPTRRLPCIAPPASLLPLRRDVCATASLTLLRRAVCATGIFACTRTSSRVQAKIPSIMSEDNDDSESGSDGSEGAKAARDRLAPKTQRDYSGYINELVAFACRRREEFADCMSSPTTVTMPVDLKLGKAFVCYLRDRLISWPMDPRPEDRRTYLKHYSKSKINNACLAIKNTFTLLSIPVPEADATFYNNFAQAYVNILARDKATGAFPGVEGTIALGHDQIKKIINAAFRYGLTC